MRSEKEMLDLILEVARRDKRIRAVYMNGSRTNPNVEKDIFQDYDIVYAVTETAGFIADENWISVFGDPLIVQQPEKLDSLQGKPCHPEESYGYLMLFSDGNRIDLHIDSIAFTKEVYGIDSLTIPLLDKDGLFPPIEPASDVSYHVKKPSAGQYLSACNDFWWCMQNVAKGLRRGQLPYAKNMLEQVIRPHLDDMVSWWIGCHYNFRVSVGAFGKYFEKYLPEDYWELYKNTHCSAECQSVWNAVFHFCDLFQALSRTVAECLDFAYKTEEAENMTAYLKMVYRMPLDVGDFQQKDKLDRIYKEQ